MDTPITASLMEEIRLAVRHGAPAEVDLAYFQRLVRAGADPQAAFGALCDPLLPYCDAARARVAQWLLILPTVEPMEVAGFAKSLQKARGQDFFQVCVQGLAARDRAAGEKGYNLLHALAAGAAQEAWSTLYGALHVLTPFPDTTRGWLRQSCEKHSGATPAHLAWRLARESLTQHAGRLRDHPLLMSGVLPGCTVELARHGANLAQPDGAGLTVFNLITQANAEGLGEIGAPPWGTWEELLRHLERFGLHQATKAAPERERPGPRL